MLFPGFPAGKYSLISLPELFFSDLLPKIEHLGEMKVALYVLWHITQSEGTFRFVQREDFLSDVLFMEGMVPGKKDNARTAEAYLDESLQRCVEHAILLDVTISCEDNQSTFYFLNSPKGRAAIEAVQNEKWNPFDEDQPSVQLKIERSNIFRLYEENIGVLTPLIADLLRDAEQIYPLDWIEEAMQIAVTKNVRNWRYIEAILRRWQEKGRDNNNRQEENGDDEEEYRKYVKGKYAEYIQH
ncbi:MAG: DnaD domain protein [Chloroflexota bacterium]|jgi:DnaD/phage-associated family protein